jgi:serine/threonine protein kinase
MNDFTAYGYEAIQELGINYGGGRITYLARKIDDQSLVVIKQFQFARSGSSWEGYKAIEREIDILKQLDHPNIPKYLTKLETPDGYCIVQQYIDARSLADILKSPQLYTPEQVKAVICKLLEVIVYLQDTFTEPLIHRDIKPANILIDDYSNPYLIDFGGAKISEGEGGTTVVVGTAGFMPPEQRLSMFNQTTDIYSLGLTIVSWLTNTEPNEMKEIIDPATNKVDKLLRKLPTYSPRFIEWIEKTLQPNPKERYSNAKLALEAFKPLYVKRVPKLSESVSDLEFASDKLGERISQTISVKNHVEETILEGWWEIVSHPVYPPDTSGYHEWISISPKEFKKNEKKFSITVDTKQLMANKLYERNLLLHTNCEQEIYEVKLKLKTALIPIGRRYIPWLDMMSLWLAGFVVLLASLALLSTLWTIIFFICVVIYNIIIWLWLHRFHILVVGILAFIGFIWWHDR